MIKKFLFWLVMITSLILVGLHHSVLAQSSGDLAYGKAVSSVSSVAAGSIPGNIVDGSDATYWQSATGGIAWISIDLGTATNVGRVVVKWGSSSSTNYNIELSNDGLSYFQVWSGVSGNFDSIVGRTGRHIRIYSVSGNDPNLYQLATLEVYVAPAPAPIPSLIPSPSSLPTMSPTPPVLPTATPFVSPIVSPTVIPTTTTTTTTKRGDINRDKKIDLQDLSVIMSSYNQSQKYSPEVDLDNDKKVDKNDYNIIVEILSADEIVHKKPKQ